MAIVYDLLLFLFTGATLTLLLWTGFEIFRAQEDPLSDRLEGLQSQAMVVAARATRRKKSAQGLDRFLYVIALVHAERSKRDDRGRQDRRRQDHGWVPDVAELTPVLLIRP